MPGGARPWPVPVALACIIVLLLLLRSFYATPPVTTDPPGSPAAATAGSPGAAVTLSSRALVAQLRERFTELELRAMATESVAIEDAARQQLGEGEPAYERMAEGWAALCAAHGITELERQALEDEAIRKDWLGPPPQ